MVSIPDRAPMNAPRTPQPNGRLAQTGDLGLGAVGDALTRTGRGLQNSADLRATEAFDATQAEFDRVYLPEAHAYDGRTEGFARTQTARYDGVLDATAEGLDPDARQAFDRMRPQRRTAQVEAAIRVESQRSVERRLADRDRATRIDALERVASVRVAYGQRKRALVTAYDGSTPDLTDQGLAILDEEIARVVEAAPIETRETLALQLAGLRGDEWMALQTFEAQARDAHVATTANKAADALIAAVVGDPQQYDASLRAADELGAELPATLRTRLVEATKRDLTVSRFQGMLDLGNYETVLTELDSGDWDDRLGADAKARVLQAAQQRRAAAGFDPVSVQRQLDQDTIARRAESHLASIVQTGQPSDLTAAEVRAVGGPVAEAAFIRQEANARAAYSVTRGLAGLPLGEQQARVESLKPRGGEPDFAERQVIYELAKQTMEAGQQLQDRDPAAATQASEANASLWRRYQSDPSRTSATMWAADTLLRQRAVGTPETSLRILPVSAAQAIAGRVKNAEGADTLPALQAAAAMVSQFNSYEGRILTELTRAGMDPRDAAIVGQAGDNPVALEQYARARARGNVGLTADMRRRTRAATRERLAPLLATWAPLPGGQSGSDAFVGGVEMVAASLVADGRNPDQAAREAAEIYTSSYRFRGGWRIPVSMAERPVTVLDEGQAQRRDPRGARGPQARNVTPPVRRTLPTAEAVEIGGYRSVVDLVQSDGAGLEATGAEPHLTDEQKRRRAADTVATHGRWVSTLDDSGLMLVVPDPGRPGGVMPVHNAAGEPIRRTWAQLLERAARPARQFR